MGKARIVSGGTEGNYTVEVLHNRQRIEDEIAFIDHRLAQLAPQLAETQEALAYADLEVAEAKMLADGLIDIYEEEGALPPVDLGNLVGLHNAVRTARGLDALTVSAQLNAAAQGHAEWLATNNTSGHTGANGSTPSKRIQASGYPGSGGENVAVGIQPPEAQALDAWMKSPGHKANILREVYRHIGVGYACRSDGQHRHFWVAVFGTSLESVAGGTPSAPSACTDSADDAPERIMEAIEELAEKSKVRDTIRLAVTALEARKLSDEARKKELQAVPADPIRQAWCADHTEDLAGEVGTAEIPGEGNARLIVRPGYDGRATVVSARDGQLLHRRGLTGAQAYFSAAILPGWQKFKPTYRVGTLTAVNEAGDTASVNLDSEQSSAQALGINQSSSLADVPVEYMECDAQAFEVGDRVLVQFEGQNWSSPKVIGFESEPRVCPVVAVIPLQVWARRVVGVQITEVGTYEDEIACLPEIPAGNHTDLDIVQVRAEIFRDAADYAISENDYWFTTGASRSLIEAETFDELSPLLDGMTKKPQGARDWHHPVISPTDLTREFWPNWECFTGTTVPVRKGGTAPQAPWASPFGLRGAEFVLSAPEAASTTFDLDIYESTWYGFFKTPDEAGMEAKTAYSTDSVALERTLTGAPITIASDLPNITHEGTQYKPQSAIRWVPGDLSTSRSAFVGGSEFDVIYYNAAFLLVRYERA